jgi:hypothetical protein
MIEKSTDERLDSFASSVEIPVTSIFTDSQVY